MKTQLRSLPNHVMSRLVFLVVWTRTNLTNLAQHVTLDAIIYACQKSTRVF